MSNATPVHPTGDQLSAFDRGRLPPAERTAVEEHVAGCADCCAQLERVPDDTLLRLIRDTHAEPQTKDPQDPTVAQSPPVFEPPPALVDHSRYRILGYLGGGGMGAVFQAEHRLMDRRVALKIIRPNLVAHPAAVERFRLEMKAAARLSHPAIVAAFDAEQAGDVHFLVTEFIEGIDLERWVRRHGLPEPAEACDWIAQAALGLQHAHERGMVHRDLKPSNLLRTPEGGIKILDFGLARFASEAPAVPFTPSDVMVGTPDFMAPEQALDPRRADIRSDIYSLGCTLYFLLTARPPFPGGTAVQKLIDHQEKIPVPLADLRPEAPEWLTAVVLRMMAKSPADRFQTPREVAAALRPSAPLVAAGGAAMPATGRGFRRASLATAFLGLVLVGGISAVVWRTRSDPAPPSDGAIPSSAAAAPSTDAATTRVGTDSTSLASLDRRTAQERSRKAAWDWFEKESGRRPDSQFMTDHRAYLNVPLDETAFNGYFFAIGGGLLKSGKTTFVVVRSGEVISEPVTAAQARRRRIPEMSATQLRIEEPLPVATPVVELFDLRVEFAAEIDPNEPLRGSVSYRLLRPIPTSLCLRFTPYPGHGDYAPVVNLQQEVNPAGGRWSFTAPPLGPPKEPQSGVMLLLVDLCSNPGGGKPKVVLSNTAHLLIELAPGPEKKASPDY